MKFSDYIIIIFIALELYFFLKGWLKCKHFNTLKEQLIVTINILEYYTQTEERVVLHEYIQNQEDEKQISNNLIQYIKKKDKAGLECDYKEIETLVNNQEISLKSDIFHRINLLPVIGLIGTFGGIAIALYLIGLSLEYDNMVNFIASIRLVFVSSLVGLLLAAILKGRYESQVNKYRRTVRQFFDYILIDFMLNITPQKPEEVFLKSIKNLSHVIKQFAQSLDSSLHNFVGNISILFAKQNEQFDAQSQNLNEISTGLITKLNSSVKSFIDNTLALNTTAELLNENGKELQKIYDYINDENRKSLELLTHSEEMMQSLTAVQNDIQQSIRSLSQDWQGFNSSIQDVNTSLKSTNNNISDSNAKLSAMFEKLSNIYLKSDENVKLYTEKIDRFLILFSGQFEVIKESKQNAKDFLEGIDQIYIKLNDTIENLNKYSADLNSAAKQLIDAISNELVKTFEDIRSRENLAINIPNLEKHLTENAKAIEQQTQAGFNKLQNDVASIKEVVTKKKKPFYKKFFGRRK